MTDKGHSNSVLGIGIIHEFLWYAIGKKSGLKNEPRAPVLKCMIYEMHLVNSF